MAKRKARCIGGPADGRVVEFDDRLECVALPVLHTPAPFDPRVAPPQCYEVVNYVPQVLRVPAAQGAGHRDVILLAPAGADMGATMRQLLDGYRPGEEGAQRAIQLAMRTLHDVYPLVPPTGWARYHLAQRELSDLARALGVSV